MPHIALEAPLLEDFEGNGTTAGSGHKGWVQVNGAYHSVVVTRAGGTLTVAIEWSLDGVTVGASDSITFASNIGAAHQSGRPWRFVRANVASNTGPDAVNALVSSI